MTEEVNELQSEDYIVIGIINDIELFFYPSERRIRVCYRTKPERRVPRRGKILMICSKAELKSIISSFGVEILPTSTKLGMVYEIERKFSDYDRIDTETRKLMMSV